MGDMEKFDLNPEENAMEESGITNIEASRPELFIALGEWILAQCRRRPKQDKKVESNSKEKDIAQTKKGEGTR